MEPVPPGHEVLEILDLPVLELNDRSALAADEVIVVRGQVAFIPPGPLPEIEFFCVSEPFEEFQRPVHRNRSDPRSALPDGMRELFNRNVIPCAEESLNHDSPASAPLASGGQYLAVDPLKESFQRGGRLPLLMMKFNFIIPPASVPVKTFRREETGRQK